MFKFLKALNKFALGLNVIHVLLLMISGKHQLLIWPLLGMVGAMFAIKSLELIEKQINGDKDDNSKTS